MQNGGKDVVLSVDIHEAGYSKSQLVLRNIQFSIEPGELIGFIGPNGAGKSSTIQSLIGVIYHVKRNVHLSNYAYIPERLIFLLKSSFSLRWDSINHRTNQPLLFRHSTSIFRTKSKDTGLLELLIKSFLRHKVYVSSYGQMVGISLFAISLVPLWIKWLILIAFILFIHSWLKSVLQRMLDHTFSRSFLTMKRISRMFQHFSL